MAEENTNQNKNVNSIENLHKLAWEGKTSLVQGKSLRLSPKYNEYIKNKLNKEARKQETIERNKNYGNTIPISDEMAEKIIGILTPCPTGEFATRIFRQHEGLGLCWHDSLFMMFFENQYLKPIVLQLVKDYLFEIYQRKYNGLKYNAVRFHNIAKALKKKHAPKVDITIWEMVTLALHRYIMEAVLYLKEPPKQTTLIKSSLSNRRPSIGEGYFDELHEYFKTSTTYCSEEGASKQSIQYFMINMMSFIREITQKSYLLSSIRSKTTPSKRIGYFFSIQTYKAEEDNNSYRGNAHIISLFLCDNLWFLYDNETGVTPLSKEMTEAITKHGIQSIKMLRDSKNYYYDLILENGEIVKVKMPHIHGDLENEVKPLLEYTVPDTSYCLIMGDDPLLQKKNSNSNTTTTTKVKENSALGAGAGEEEYNFLDDSLGNAYFRKLGGKRSTRRQRRARNKTAKRKGNRRH